MGTLLVGIDLAERADLQEKFITNNERYQKICDRLQNKTGTASERLLGLVPTIRALERYHFVANGIDVGPLMTVAQLAAMALVACNQSLPEDLANAVTKCAGSKRADGELRRLAAIEVLNKAFEKPERPTLAPEAQIVRDIIHLVWMSLCHRYYWLKEKDQQNKS